MSRGYRLKGGLIDRDRPLRFTFNGADMAGFSGDTLASALLANGQRLVGRSFKYHRPRGIFSAGSEEPNALVQLRRGAHAEPNSRATVSELFDGLQAFSQNHRGSLEFDLMAVADYLAPLLSAGFYYKTFMWPKSFWEKVYEPVIRASAGLGRLSAEADPDTYDKGFLHCDVLVVGGGPAGLAAALTAARAGARVILADEDFRFGGRLNCETMTIDDRAGAEWAARTIDELAALKTVRLMPRSTVYGAFDHGIYGALQRVSDHLADGGGKPRQILWRVYSKQAIVCAGAIERGIAFGNNDRPGVMLAGAVRAYANRWAVAPGRRVAVFTNNDDGWRTAADLAAKDIEIAAVVDSRDCQPLLRPAGARIAMGARIVDVKGRKGVRAIKLSDGSTIEADCVAVSGGWSPNVHLTCHQRGRPVWRDDIAGFVPGDDLPAGMRVAGAANGALTLARALDEGQEAGAEAAVETGHSPRPPSGFRADDEPAETSAFWHVAESSARAFLDLQNDVTVKDVELAYREGFRSMEHIKRYTTLGMATDQGKTANIPALAIAARSGGRSMGEIGTTIFRPPYTPVPIGAFAGRARGREFRPTRLTPGHQWAADNGATFVEAGAWLRAQWFSEPGERHWRQSVDREVLQTRKSVGICDVSSLGKIDIKGRDAAQFLNRVYANGFAKLPVGRVRYGLMLREDGIAMDDGTTARLADNHFLMTTTTANAGSVFRHLEFCRQCLWPELDVHLISVTDQWAQYSVAGPNSRELLQTIVDRQFDISNDAFAFMACADITVCNGVRARLFRISYSGERAYELAVPARFGQDLMRVMAEAGREFGAVFYGTEALGVLRLEKGHVAGSEICGHTTAGDLGLGRMVARNKDFIGGVLSRREALADDDRPVLAGFVPVDRKDRLAAGAHFIARGKPHDLVHDEGWMSSVAHSPHLGHDIGLGFIKNGTARHGETVVAADPLRDGTVEVEIVSPHFFDPDGERQIG